MPLDVRPGAHVAWLLLEPDDFLRTVVALEDLGQRFGWEWIQLLEAHNGYVVSLCPAFVRLELGPDVPTAQHNPPHPSWMFCRGIVKHWFEATLHQVGGTRSGQRMAQQALGCHDHQWPRILTEA